MIRPLRHWRLASAAVVLILVGSGAVAVALLGGRGGGTVSFEYAGHSAIRPDAMAARRTGVALAGVRLMSQAAAACRRSAFSGMQVSRWWGPVGLRVTHTYLWHAPDRQAVARTVALAPPDGGSATAEPGAASILISARQLTLLTAGYLLEYAGSGVAAGRAATVVAVKRPDGTLVARYWLDARTRLPLRRQLYDDAGLVSDVTLTGLRLGSGALAGMPSASSPPGGKQLTLATVRSLRVRGWPLPPALPGDLTMVAASELPGRVIGLSYSDGLSALSLFVQQGDLRAVPAGWRRIVVEGHQTYAADDDGQAIAWSAGGYVFTVISAAPQVTVDQAIEALPHAGPSGLWPRLSRGFRRLASLADPFR